MDDRVRQAILENLTVMRKNPIDYRVHTITMATVNGMLITTNILTGSAWTLVKSECLQEFYAHNKDTDERIAATKWLQDQRGEPL